MTMAKMLARKFGIDRKSIRTWIRAEEKIRDQTAKSKASGRGRKARFPNIEKKLYDEFKTMRKEGKIVKHWWFQKRVMQLIKDANIEEKIVKA